MTSYVTSISFENRCFAQVKELTDSQDDCTALIIDFEGYENVGAYLANRRELLLLLKNRNISTRVIRARLRAPLTLIHELEKHSDWLSSDIVLDISTLPRPHLFCIAKFLIDQGRPVEVVYYRPEKYGSHLSRGVHSIFSLPGFEGDMDLRGSTILALILGFEGYKALYAWEAIGPAKTEAFLGDPPFRQEFLDTSKENNKDLLAQIPNVHTRSLHASDAGKAIQQLANFVLECKSHNQHDSIIVCPLGTKIQALACLALAYAERDITIAYVSSRNYFTDAYSRGYDREPLKFSLNTLIEIAHSTLTTKPQAAEVYQID